MSRRYLPAIGLIVGLAPAMAHAQTNIDEGKSPSQIFASDCNACHKSPKGLAQGRNAGGIADFLRQHYTASREQAGALAAYILGAKGGEGGKPIERASSKPPEDSGKPSGKQARRPPKGEEPPGRAAKLQQPKGDEEEEPTPPSDVPISVEEPAPKPNEKEKPAARGRKGEPKTSAAAKRGRHAAPAEVPTVASAPAPVEPSTPPLAPAAAAVPSAEPGETVPRDDIPD